MNQKETKQVVETQESKEKMVVLKRSPKSVSYTHLDVYKRQPW